LDKMTLLEQLAEAVIAGDPNRTSTLSASAIGEIDPLEAIEDGLAKGVMMVGNRFENGEMFLTDLIMAAEAMKAGIDVLEPELLKTKRTRKTLGKVVIGTVAGDIHDIGKRIVCAMLVANGFEVVDLGVDVPREKFIEKVKEFDADVLGLSALLTTTIIEQGNVIRELSNEGIRKKLKVIVGGAAVSEQWAQNIGADAFATDAVTGVGKIKMLVPGGYAAER